MDTTRSRGFSFVAPDQREPDQREPEPERRCCDNAANSLVGSDGFRSPPVLDPPRAGYSLGLVGCVGDSRRRFVIALAFAFVFYGGAGLGLLDPGYGALAPAADLYV